MENYLIPVYAVYTVCAVALVVGLARLLFQNGAVFLEDVFEDNHEVARSVNRLLVTGFFMLNLGYAFFLLKADAAADATEGFEVLAAKLGLLLISLAVVHFLNMVVFWRLRRRQTVRHLPPPVAPQRWVAPPPNPGPGPAPAPPAAAQGGQVGAPWAGAGGQ